MRMIRETWKMLGRSIFVGERYEKSMKGIAKMSLIVTLAGFVMFVMNLASAQYLVSLTSIAFLLTGLAGYLLTSVTQHRKAAMIITIGMVLTVLTYNVLFVSNGFAFLWTILVPLAVSYFFSVRAGIIVSFYFSVLFAVAFYSPMRGLVEGNYPEIILNRFPILYFFLFITTSFVMIQYHRSVLDQIDYAEELEKARETADQANKAKSDFLAEMSHEIRTPINAVLGMNEMIRRESDLGGEGNSEEERTESFRRISEYAGNIEEAGGNLLSIINDILDFSKIEAGRMELVDNDYELNTLLSDVSNMISFRVREKGLEYILDVDEKIPNDLYGDKVRVRQIITNLLTNAYKYTRQGSVRMEVRAEEETFRPGGMITLKITVRDTGVGIRQEDMQKLFVKFQRVDLEKNSTVEGTGMGLAITSSLLAMMGGSIHVESVYGEGSAFTVLIPQRVVGMEPLGSVRSGDRGGRRGRVYRESFHAPDARILVVDDTRMNIAVTVGLLQKTGLQIDTARNGPDALELAKENAYDLILLDQRMPGMDGIETLRRLREMKDSPSAAAPVICMTADAIIGAKEKYTGAGFTDYLPKPVTGETLEKTIARHLPAGKVTLVRCRGEQEDEPAENSPAGRYDPMREAGIDPETGLKYCQNDAALYDSLLRDYVSGEYEKTRDLRTYLEAEDWKQYAILAHALKSTSRMIGAEELAEKAAALEAAANREDREYLRENHSGAMEKYRETTDAIRRATEYRDSGAGPEEDVLEFEPEGI